MKVRKPAVVHEDRILLATLSAGLPAVVTGLILLWTRGSEARVEWTLSVVILGFWLRWPIGLAILTFMILSGRLGRCAGGSRGRWYNMGQQQQQGGAGNGGGWGSWGKWGCGGGGAAQSAYRPSGNKAFDDYRSETLRRLEEEQQEFQAYLERLRQARDKQEFDQFMSERRNRNGGTGNGPTVPAETV